MHQREPDWAGLDAEHHVVARATASDGRDMQAGQFVALGNLGLQLGFQSATQC